MSKKESAESVVREIRRKTRKKYSAEEKIRIVLEGLRGEESIAALCRRERINPNLAFQSIFHKMEFQSKLAIPYGNLPFRDDPRQKQEELFHLLCRSSS